MRRAHLAALGQTKLGHLEMQAFRRKSAASKGGRGVAYTVGASQENDSPGSDLHNVLVAVNSAVADEDCMQGDAGRAFTP